MESGKRNALIAVVFAFAVWPAFWLLVMEHWHTRFVGPIYIFSLMMLPMAVVPGVGLYLQTRRERRWIVAVAIAVVVALDLGMVPLLAALGVRGPH